MNPWQLLRLFPNASKAVLAANASEYGSGIPEETAPSVKRSRKSPELERDSGHAPLRASRPKKAPTARFLVRITDVRKRLIDPDNLCEKFHLDLCRYAGILPDDSAKTINLETLQRKASKGEEPHTEIVIHELL